MKNRRDFCKFSIASGVGFFSTAIGYPLLVQGKAQGRGKGGFPAGSEPLFQEGIRQLEILGQKLDRNIVISISNETGLDLVEPKTYIYSGNYKKIPEIVGNKRGDNFSASKAWGSAYGTSGIVSYRFKGWNTRMAITWFVPISYLSYDNGFNLGMFLSDRPTNKERFDYYYDRRKNADTGSFTWKRGNSYTLTGIMDNGPNALLRVYVRPS